MAFTSLQYVSAWQILAVCLIAWLGRKVAVWNRLRGFKGPPIVGFTDVLHSRALIGPRCHDWYEKVNETYGPIARIGPNVLLTSSPELWTHVNIKPGYRRSEWYYKGLRIEHRRDNVFTTTDNSAHDARRKQMAPGYSGRENHDLEPAIDACVRKFLDLIRGKYLSNEDKVVPMDLARKVQYFTLDVISLVGLGKEFGMLSSDSDVADYLKSSEEGIHNAIVGVALGIVWLVHTPWIGRLLSPSPKDSSGFGKMLSTCYRLVDERTANPTDTRSDMLASFIRHGLNGDELRSEAAEQIIAGSDTTAGALRGTLLYVMTNHRVYEKLRCEIREAVKNSTPPLPDGDIVPHSLTKQLPYLQAVIREAMRVWPPVVNSFPRDVPAGGDAVMIDGETVILPGGTCIVYSGAAMHHDKKLYGEDAKSFRPERWFEKDPSKLAAMIRTNDLSFGHGRWQCLGKPVAHIELGKVIFELFRNFDLALINPERPWKARNIAGLFAISDMDVMVTNA
ncbi:cytochrome P450 [Xylariaceae sp. FL0804]|nr:cytochrome P450 [Xylariaceae sp. FL0804]